jgi:predicted transcriptional regulator
MPETEVEQQLREAGAVFIEAHDRAALAIREAADAGMVAEEIAKVSGLSPETVAAFLRAGPD